LPVAPEPVSPPEPAAPTARDLPDVDDLRPSRGDPHRVPRAEQFEAHLLVAGLPKGVLHVLPLVHAHDVHDLVEKEITIRRLTTLIHRASSLSARRGSAHDHA